MDRLTQRQLQALLEFVRDCYACRDRDGFITHLLRALPKLIPSEVTGYKRNQPREREAEVLSWVAKGKTNAEIGLILKISVETVKKHLEHIYHKLWVENRTAVVTLALGLRAGV